MLLVAAVLLGSLLLAVPAPTRAADAGSLTAVGADQLNGRGLNAALAVADHCAYVGSRGTGPVEVVNVADPTHPSTAGEIAPKTGSTARELRAVPDQRLLIVMTYALGSGGVNRFDFYRWGADCTQLQPTGGYDFRGRRPHEFYLWHASGRTLLFTSMFDSGNPALQVLDASNPAQPALLGSWNAPAGLLHSISLSADGARAYLSLWKGGMLVADVSDFTASRPNPAVRLVTQPADAVPAPSGGNVHSAVQAPGRNLLVLTDERYPPPQCPYGPGRVVDIGDPTHPRQVSTLLAPENDPAACARAPTDVYSSHNPTLTASLAIVTWYASGVQVFDLTDPANPGRLAEYRPQGALPAGVDPQLVGTTTMSWSYPIIKDGLIYVADINQGLFVLRYAGPHQEEVSGLAFSEGNSNLTQVKPPPNPTPSATAHPASPAATPSIRSSASRSGQPAGIPVWALAIAAGVLLAAALAGGAIVVRRR